MNGLIDMVWGYYVAAQPQEKAKCKEFERRAEQARQKYWEACKLPRKLKKCMRKEAREDFVKFSMLAIPTLFPRLFDNSLQRNDF